MGSLINFPKIHNEHEEHPNMVKQVVKLIKALTKACFHGTLILSFRNGVIFNIKKEESLDLTEL